MRWALRRAEAAFIGALVRPKRDVTWLVQGEGRHDVTVCWTRVGRRDRTIGAQQIVSAAFVSDGGGSPEMAARLVREALAGAVRRERRRRRW